MDFGFVLACVAVSVAGIAAVVGLWMERDPNRPPKWAYSLSILIIMTTLVTVATSWWDTSEDNRREGDAVVRHDLEMKGADERQVALTKETDFLKDAASESKVREEKMANDIARMLVTLDELAGLSDDPALKAFVKEEVNSQSRGNEKIVKKVAQRVKDKGGDPDAMLAKHLPAEELSRVARKITFAPPASMKGKMNKAKGRSTQSPKGTAGRPTTGKPTGRPTAGKPTGRPTAGKPTGRPTGNKPTGRPTGNKNTGRPTGRP